MPIERGLTIVFMLDLLIVEQRATRMVIPIPSLSEPQRGSLAVFAGFNGVFMRQPTYFNHCSLSI